MTKDRPRNRPGTGRKSGGSAGAKSEKPARPSWGRGRDERPASGGGIDAGDDKPWSRGQSANRPSGDKPKRFGDRPAGGVDSKPRGEFRGKANDKFKDKGRDRPERSRDNPDHRANDGDKPRPETHRPARREGGRPQHTRHHDRRDAAFEENGEVWIWGLHAAGAALANPKRKISKAYISRNGAVRAGLDPEALPKFAELLDPREIDLRLPPGAVHQGLAVRCAPLDGLDISDAIMRPEHPLVILDQVTDPQNVGAVFRSAAAFGIGGVIMQTRNAPALGGALAKAATGAIERVEEIRAVNLSRAIDALRDAGWRVIGLDGSAEQTLDEAFAGDEPLAIVLGAEGAGIRQGVAKACTGLARIPIGAAMESLNVSNAAAIAFYEAAKRGGAAPPPPKPAASPADDEGAAEDEFD